MKKREMLNIVALKYTCLVFIFLGGVVNWVKEK
jgi:hypothetical protein